MKCVSQFLRLSPGLSSLQAHLLLYTDMDKELIKCYKLLWKINPLSTLWNITVITVTVLMCWILQTIPTELTHQIL